MDIKREGDRLSATEKILSRIGRESGTEDLAKELDKNKSTHQARILRRMRKGTCTVKTLAHDLDMGERTVEAILSFMVHDGYIEDVSCSNTCRLCPMSCNQDASIKMYTLTSKSIEYLEQ